MKKSYLIVGSALFFFSLNAFAGGGSGCLYSPKGELASMEGQEKMLEDGELMDPELLALLKKQREEKLLELPVIHN